jgi:uncharacterized protein YgiM (DUF1202 family)
MRLFLFGAAFAISVWVGIHPVLAEKRVALIIGNGAYPVGSLRNPPNDARLMGKTLRKLGFEVIERTDLTQRGMKRAISEFGSKLSKAGEDAVGMFYYAGHGVQAKGNNYLLPTDAELDRESDLELFAVRANWVLGQMEEAGNRINLVVLDACRNNPFARSWKRSSTRGLARMQAPRGTMIAYATRPGDVAADGRGENSPYTKAFSKAIQTPGLTLSDVFIDTRNSVMRATNDDQVPWEEGGLTSRFYFAGKAAKQQVVSVTAPPLPRLDREVVYWNSIKSSTDAADFEDYIDQFPKGGFIRIAKRKLKRLRKNQTASLAPTPPAQSNYKVSSLDEEMVAAKTANIRSGPSVGNKKIGKIVSGKTVSVIGKSNNEGALWYQVLLENGLIGYVHGTLLKTHTTSKSTKTATTGGSTKPSNTGNNLTELGKVVRTNRDWNLIVVRLQRGRKVADGQKVLLMNKNGRKVSARLSRVDNDVASIVLSDIRNIPIGSKVYMPRK